MIDLRAVRRASGLMQKEVAENIGYNTPQQVNNVERALDPPLSTVARFIEGCGGTAVLTVEVNGQVLKFDLTNA